MSAITLVATALAGAGTGPPSVSLVDELPLGVSLTATGAGALVGALRGLGDENHDVMGMAVLALCLGFGGGLARDILLGESPPIPLRTPWHVLLVGLATVLVALFGRHIRRLEPVLMVFDAASLGLFAILGTQQALLRGVPLLPAIVVGAVAAVAGGIAADLLQQRTPMVLAPGPPYALAATAGAASFGMLVDLGGIDARAAAAIAVVLTFAGRITTYLLGIETRPQAGWNLGRRRSDSDR